ncbi:DUF2306 domain-containing protein [Mesorhizobium sp. CAU 1741]|uniref:DUF2306 domain-containing protein n=1 Tax=Mesorhizobium sp. CAU 1741 TaxID=3140366 RepID=UPI00325A8016
MTLTPLLEASFAIKLHVLAATLAFLLGGLVLFRRKGGPYHRLAGRVWVGLMLVVALSSFFIHMIRLVGPWSPIHLLSIATLWYLYRGVQAARQKRIPHHRGIMQGLFLGALVGAGLFTFLPGRIMHEVFFGGSQPWIGVGVAAALVVAVALLLCKMLRDSSLLSRFARAR